MATARELAAVYTILGNILIESDPYDARGGFILLRSIADGMPGEGPRLISGVDHLHIAAGVGDSGSSREDARASMIHVVETLERKLARG